MDICAIHLRKSRTDEQAEARGEGDVLARHRKTLQELAAYHGYTVVAEYCEVVSGEKLANRPEAQRMLLDVMSGKYMGVLCMDIDRLSRGDAADQATIIRAFQSSDTKVITPGQIYDFNTPAGEDFGELKLMFARIESKSIKRRMYTGRERSAKDGCYIGARIPYGYAKVPARGKDGPTLAVIPEQAEVVLKIFQMYADGKSSHMIADELNGRGVKPNYSEYWSPSTIRKMLKNPLYVGMITWGKRVSRPAPDGSVKRVISSKPICVPGKHPSIVPQPLWDAVAARLAGNAAPPVKNGKRLQNPLHGLVRCARCGQAMQRHNNKTPAQKYDRPDVLRCHNRQCSQIRSDLAVVESMILRELEAYYSPAQEVNPLREQQQKDRQKAAKLIADQIKQAEAQQSRQADLLEQGVYSVEDFLARRESLRERLVELHRRYDEVTEPDWFEDRQKALRDIVPRSMTISEAYRRAPDNETRNALLAALVKEVRYDKAARRRSRYAPPEEGITLEFVF